MSYQRIAVRRMTGGCGAEIDGPDLKKPLDEQTVAEIRKALVEHCCVFLRGQEGMTDLDQARFAGYFGTFGRDPFVEGEETHPSVLKVAKEADEGKNPTFGGNWHSDWSFLETPPAFTFLHARELPPYGGDTMFANQYLAYEALSDGMKKMLAGLRAVHSDIRVAGPQADKNKGRSTKHRDGADWRETRNVHPVVRTNPETGRKMLFVNKSYTMGFEGMTEAESKPLLDFLLEHGNRPEFTFRYRWRKGSIAFWDNRSTKHIAVGDTGPFHRLLRRIQICGDRPV